MVERGSGTCAWVLVLAAASLVGCGGGGGAKAPDGGARDGGASGIGGGAAGGATGNLDAATSGDRPCGAAPPVRTYATQRILGVSDSGSAITVRTDGTPLVMFQAGPSGGTRIVAATKPQTVVNDAGVSVEVNMAHPLSALGPLSPAAVQTTHTGEVRMAYVGNYVGNYAMRYLEWNGDLAATPTEAQVGNDSAANIAPALALDGQDHPSIAYATFDGNVRLAQRNGTAWTVETVRTGLIAVETSVALVMDTAGNPIVITAGMGNALPGVLGLVVSTRSAGTWTSTTIHPDTSDTKPLAALSPSGEPTVLFASSHAIARAVLRAGAWQVDAPLSPDGMSLAADNGFAFVFATDGSIHVAFSGSGGGLAHGTYDGCHWFIETVDNDPTAGPSPAVTLDAAGKPYFAYQRTTNNGSGPEPEVWYAAPR